MIRARTVLFGVTLLLSSCGKKFEANEPTAGSAGMPTSDAGRSNGGSSGSSAGSASGGTSSSGAPGAGNGGGTTPSGGAPSGGASSGGAPSGGAPSGGAGGVIGVAGSPVVDMDGGVTPPIPLLGLALWLRADRGVTASAGRVSEWLDQSGNQMDGLQTAGNARPTLQPTGLNGMPTLDFDGKVQYLRLPDGFTDFSKGLSGFVVSKATVTDDACASTVEFSNGSEVDDIEFGYWKQGWQYEVFDHDFSGGMVTPAEPELYAVLHRPTQEAVMRLNGNQANTSMLPLPVVKVRQENFIGHTLYAGCDYYQGQISEVVLYNRIVTDKELIGIESYLADKWALKLDQPTP